MFNFICGALGQNISFKPKNSKKITQAKLEHDLSGKIDRKSQLSTLGKIRYSLTINNS